METLLPGITLERVPTSRLTVAVLSVTGRTGPAVLFVHGNVSSSLFWQPTMLALPEPYRPLAIDLRGFGDTDPEPVDATRGLRDYADDLAAAIEALGLDVGAPGRLEHGRRRGPAVPGRPARHAPGRVADAGRPGVPVRVRRDQGRGRHPVRPARRGLGRRHRQPGVRRAAGRAGPRRQPACCPRGRCCWRTTSSRRTCRSTWTSSWSPCCPPGSATTTTRATRGPRPAWPGFAPGDRGVLNTMAPTHFRIADLSGVQPKPPVLWLRGADDVIVSDTSLYDLAYLGSLGAVPGWPGAAGLAAAAHGGADPRRAGRLRRGGRALPRGGDRGLRPRPAPGPAGAVPGRAGRASGRFVSAATRSSGRRRRARCRARGAGQKAGRPRLAVGGSRHHAGRACGAGGARDGLDQDRRRRR